MHPKGGDELSEKNPSPAKIVVVEDNSADVFLLRHALDQHAEEYILDVLRDGEEAIEFVNRQRSVGPHGEPCVIVLDLHLPKHDGTAVLKVIRRNPRWLPYMWWRSPLWPAPRTNRRFASWACDYTGPSRHWWKNGSSWRARFWRFAASKCAPSSLNTKCGARTLACRIHTRVNAR